MLHSAVYNVHRVAYYCHDMGYFETQWLYTVTVQCLYVCTHVYVCVCIRWTRAARPAGESRLSALPFSLPQDAGCSGSATAKHLPGQECHHLANVSQNHSSHLHSLCVSFLVFVGRCPQLTYRFTVWTVDFRCICWTCGCLLTEPILQEIWLMPSSLISSSGPIQQQWQQQPRVALATVLQPMLWPLWWTLQPLPRRWKWQRWRRANMNGMTTCLLGEQPACPNSNSSSSRRQIEDPCSHHMVQCLYQGVSHIQLTLRALESVLRIRALKPRSPALKRSFGLVARQLSQLLTSLM